MALKWFCDATGKEVFMSPKTEPEKDKDGKAVMTSVKTQDGRGKVKKTAVPKMKYLEEKAFVIRLTVGDETIQRTLSAEGLGRFRSQLQAMWDTLEALGPK